MGWFKMWGTAIFDATELDLWNQTRILNVVLKQDENVLLGLLEVENVTDRGKTIKMPVSSFS